MNVHTMPRLLVRLPPTIKAWLETRANENTRSVNSEIIDILKVSMQAEPLEIFLHECQSPSGVFFTVSVGKYGDDFYEGADREAAFAAARAKAKELGLTTKSIQLNSEKFNQ